MSLCAAGSLRYLTPDALVFAPKEAPPEPPMFLSLVRFVKGFIWKRSLIIIFHLNDM